MSKVDQYWRVFATGLCFTIFGLGGLVLSFLILPSIALITSDTVQRELKAQRLIRFSFNAFCQIMKFTGAIDYRIDGAELLREDRNCIIVANHPSLIDYVLIASQLPQCDCLVKAAIWENPFMKRIVKAAGYIPNQAPDDLLERCEERFSRGNVLLVFPEGTRTTPGIEPSLQRGAAQIATRTQTDLRVIHITVSPTFLTKEKNGIKFLLRNPFFMSR